jgi:voltage-gated potassium channel
VVAAVRDLGRRENLRYVNAGVQVLQWHMPFLLTEEATDPGITQVYNDLMSSGGHGNTYSMRVPPGFPHPTFGDCQVHFGRTFGHRARRSRGRRPGGELALADARAPGTTLYYVAGQRIADHAWPGGGASVPPGGQR